MDVRDQAVMLAASPFFDADWYRASYPDVNHLTGLSPAAHYLRFGIRLGRRPDPDFDAGYYLAQNPDVAAAGVEPFFHYAVYGRPEGRAGHRAESARLEGLRAVTWLRGQLQEWGLETQALAGLEDLCGAADVQVAAEAAVEIALWALRGDRAADHARVLDLVAQARRGTPEQWKQEALTAMEVLARLKLGQGGAAQAGLARAARQGRAGADAMLGMVNFAQGPAARIVALNKVMARFDLPELALMEGGGAAYDRLMVAQAPPEVPAASGQKVSVLVAAYNSAATLPVTLRALGAQSWRNLEIIVIDDASTDDTVAVARDWAARDPRISVIEMAQNGGAYVARNAGLAQATGDFVTLQDADDWCHPLRIETQARFMLAYEDVFACTSRQARMQADLSLQRWTGMGQLLTPNFSSLMLRRAALVAQFGQWDAVRVSADNELIRRIRHVHGDTAVRDLMTGPLSFQRESAGSAVADPVLGIAGFVYGARREYRDAQLFHHASAESLRYDGGARPFPAPRRMIDKGAARHEMSLVICGDFCRPDAGMWTAHAVLAAAEAPVGVFELSGFNPRPGAPGMQAALRAQVHRTGRVLCHGDEVRAASVLVLGPEVLQEVPRYMPQVRAARVQVVLPEHSDVPAQELARCAEVAAGMFPGAQVTWHPANGAARAVWASADVALAEDWHVPLPAEAAPDDRPEAETARPVLGVLGDIPAEGATEAVLVSLPFLAESWAAPADVLRRERPRPTPLPAGVQGLICPAEHTGVEVAAALAQGCPVVLLGNAPEGMPGAPDVARAAEMLCAAWADGAALQAHRRAQAAAWQAIAGR